MVDFERHILGNGLKIIVHRDESSPLAALNILFKAGSKYDPTGHSGLAHLFEHLMFSGTEQVPDFDVPVQMAGGENNAFTNSDYANYFCYGPLQNLETLLWLEADRMGTLQLSDRSLSIQKQVVVEEYFETCINVPFGDVWHHVLPVMYQDHPYHWPTIGKNEKEINSIALGDVHDFYYKYYNPGNAILTLSGDVDSDAIFRSIEHWFGDIPSNGEAALPVPHKFLNYQGSSIRLDQDVPVRTFYLIFPMSSRQSKAYYAFDLLSDVLASGRSALLYSSLVKEKALLTQVDAYITGTTESGLFIIEGQLAVGVTFDEVYTQVWGELDTMRNGMMNQVLFEKLINTVETNLALSETSVLHKGMSLAYFEALGDANGINEEVDRYRDISKDMLVEIVGLYLNPNMATKVEYHPITKA